MYKKILFFVCIVLASEKSSTALIRRVKTLDVDKVLCGLELHASKEKPSEYKEIQNYPEVALCELYKYDLCLCDALLKKDKTRIQELIEIFDLNAPIPYFGGSYLKLASQIGDGSIVCLLKKYEACFLCNDFMDETIPLHIAVYFGHLEIVKELLKKFPNLKIAERFLKGKTALYLALYTQHDEIADCMIKNGFEIDRESAFSLEMKPKKKQQQELK